MSSGPRGPSLGGETLLDSGHVGAPRRALGIGGGVPTNKLRHPRPGRPRDATPLEPRRCIPPVRGSVGRVRRRCLPRPARSHTPR
eukprot:5899983-Pyramimonas_sp.AAC.1